MLCGCMILCFKQKTAYEMRISDWSSDVCSSDLRPERHIGGAVDLAFDIAGLAGLKRQLRRYARSQAKAAMRIEQVVRTVIGEAGGCRGDEIGARIGQPQAGEIVILARGDDFGP